MSREASFVWWCGVLMQRADVFTNSMQPKRPTHIASSDGCCCCCCCCSRRRRRRSLRSIGSVQRLHRAGRPVGRSGARNYRWLIVNGVVMLSGRIKQWRRRRRQCTRFARPRYPSSPRSLRVAENHFNSESFVAFDGAATCEVNVASAVISAE